ncbi:MAG TPA: trehalose-6-phosphate synthase [Dehalococcoidia bacterium]|nr:trehalose-6-phosphate synthase [Dehalococcoidia bacterium]
MIDTPATEARLNSLESLSAQLLSSRRLIIASNRGPLEHDIEPDGTLTAKRGAGGMVTALLATARFVPLTWVAAAMTDGDRRAAVEADNATVKVPDYEIYVRFVSVPQPVYQRHYYVLCNPLLWFVQHFMWNTPRTPNIGRVVYDAWDNGYVPMNQAVADAICDEAEHQGEPPIVLIQDYHLYLAPKMVRERAPEATITHFTHIPWPGPRYWGMLPEFMRRAIHESMVACDIVGLQTNADVLNFLHCCVSILNARVDYEASTVEYKGRRTRVCHYPISVDSAGLIEFAQSPEVQRYVDALRPAFGEQTIVRVDRSEPSKNIIRGLRAYELMLERYPDLRGHVNLVSLLVPSRSDLGLYQTYTDEIFELVDSINEHYGDVEWQPVRVYYEENYPQAIAAMTQYDVLLVNPIVDGMNLVSKEGPLVNKGTGVLVLSEQAGSFEQLSDYVLAVAPTDLEGTVRALHQALTMPEDERRRRASALRQIVEDEDIIKWLEHQFTDLIALSQTAH